MLKAEYFLYLAERFCRPLGILQRPTTLPIGNTPIDTASTNIEGTSERHRYRKETKFISKRRNIQLSAEHYLGEETGFGRELAVSAALKHRILVHLSSLCNNPGTSLSIIFLKSTETQLQRKIKAGSFQRDSGDCIVLTTSPSGRCLISLSLSLSFFFLSLYLEKKGVKNKKRKARLAQSPHILVPIQYLCQTSPPLFIVLGCLCP